MSPAALALVILLVAAFPASASAEAPASADTLFPENLGEVGDSIIQELHHQLDKLRDHIELRGKTQSQPQDQKHSGWFSLKLYPKGKSQSDEHTGISGHFSFSTKPGDLDLDLNLNLSTPSETNSEDYI